MRAEVAVVHCDAPFRRLEASELAFWEASEASGVSDCQGRSMAMDGGLQPLVPGRRLVGQARTVRCMVGDNSALHVALDLAEPGEVLVVDGEGNLGHALWG
ncbi:MAG: RraA family protein, partial [Myxococcota bacterium]